MSSIPSNYILNGNPSKRVSRFLETIPVYGLIPCITAEGFVYSDSNMNNLFDEGEKTVGNILIRAGRKYSLSSYNGSFKFLNIPPIWGKDLKISVKQPFYTGDISKLKISKSNER